MLHLGLAEGGAEAVDLSLRDLQILSPEDGTHGAAQLRQRRRIVDRRAVPDDGRRVWSRSRCVA
eukprot:6177923-Pleurochrysis_carterae.AAC.2